MDHNPLFNADGNDENPLEGLLGALFSAMGGNGHSGDNSEQDYSDRLDYQALMAGDPQQQARCARCPAQSMCPIYEAAMKARAQQTASANTAGLTAAKMAEILDDRRVKVLLRKSIDLGVYNALNENDFLQHSIVIGLLKYDEYKREAKRQAARKFWSSVWKIVSTPFLWFFYVIASPLILLFSIFYIVAGAITWRKANARIEAELADTKSRIEDDDWFTPEDIAEILEGERNGFVQEMNTLDRWGYKLGRWVYNTTHRQPKATTPAAVEPAAEQPVQPEAEVDLTEAASAANENLLDTEE